MQLYGAKKLIERVRQTQEVVFNPLEAPALQPPVLWLGGGIPCHFNTEEETYLSDDQPMSSESEVDADRARRISDELHTGIINNNKVNTRNGQTDSASASMGNWMDWCRNDHVENVVTNPAKLNKSTTTQRTVSTSDGTSQTDEAPEPGCSKPESRNNTDQRAEILRRTKTNPKISMVSKYFTCTVKINNKIYTALFDSGANRNFITKEIASEMPEYLKKTKINQSTSSFIQADNSAIKSLGTIYITLEIDGVDISAWFEIFNRMSDQIILGMRFMVDQHIHLHADNLSWTWKHDNKTRTTDSVTPGNKICTISLTDTDQATLTSFLDAEFNLMDQAELGTLKEIEYGIELNDYTPIHVKPYRRSPKVTAALHKIIEQLLDQKIQPFNSEYSFQPVMVKKKLLPGQDPDDIKAWRMCIDYRPLNKVMKMVNYPMRRIDTSLEVIREGAYRSVIDCTNAYYQIPIKAEHRQYTAFAVEGMGSFEFIRMPFGLSTAPGTFQRKMDLLIQLLKKRLRQLELPAHWINYVHPYMDDWIIATPTFEIHLQVLKILFQIFRVVGLLIKREKCKFCISAMK